VARVIARRGAVLTVRDLDAIDGTPILDIKPVMREFLPVGEVSQPEWAHAPLLAPRLSQKAPVEPIARTLS
jgi:tRNA (Thr-GGU) A37 N-methylase